MEHMPLVFYLFIYFFVVHIVSLGTHDNSRCTNCKQIYSYIVARKNVAIYLFVKSHEEDKSSANAEMTNRG